MQHLTRRGFVAGLGGILTCLLNKDRSFAMMPAKSARPSLNKLKNALEYRGRLLGGDLFQEELEALEYAYRAINPSTHTEYAFVVWACHVCDSTQATVDEYCRRRKGEHSQTYDHPVLDLGPWCPNTHRILVFQEQWERLTSKLTQRTGIAFKIDQSSSPDDEYESYKHLTLNYVLDNDYEQRFSVDEIDRLYKVVRKDGLPPQMVSEVLLKDFKHKLHTSEISELSHMLPREAISQAMFVELVTKNSMRKDLSVTDINSLYKLIKENYWRSESFASCSALVELSLRFS